MNIIHRYRERPLTSTYAHCHQGHTHFREEQAIAKKTEFGYDHKDYHVQINIPPGRIMYYPTPARIALGSN